MAAGLIHKGVQGLVRHSLLLVKGSSNEGCAWTS